MGDLTYELYLLPRHKLSYFLDPFLPCSLTYFVEGPLAGLRAKCMLVFKGPSSRIFWTMEQVKQRVSRSAENQQIANSCWPGTSNLTVSYYFTRPVARVERAVQSHMEQSWRGAILFDDDIFSYDFIGSFSRHSFYHHPVCIHNLGPMILILQCCEVSACWLPAGIFELESSQLILILPPN